MLSFLSKLCPVTVFFSLITSIYCVSGATAMSMLTTSDELFECVLAFCGVGT